jgi:hypothetical protein
MSVNESNYGDLVFLGGQRHSGEHQEEKNVSEHVSYKFTKKWVL